MNNEDIKNKLSTEPYKGVRDFYPKDMTILNHIFSSWRKVVKSYGYEEYSASVLEPSELYKAKSGEEIVNEQTYTFFDRANREVTLRPEMTPTLARMIANKRRELTFPVRWFSIPNLFRYEKPQRGRLREHFQLNVDIFGVNTLDAEVEIILLASDIMKSFGLTERDFEIRLNDRRITNYIMREVLALDDERAYSLSKLIDRRSKMERVDFDFEATKIIGESFPLLDSLLNSENFSNFVDKLPSCNARDEAIKSTKELISKLEAIGITNVRFDQALMRGFDYYTGTIFEIYDTNPENKRALFGGGRYDDLLSLFGEEKIPAFGFGMGDVTIAQVLSTRNMFDSIKNNPAEVAFCLIDPDSSMYARDIANILREKSISSIIDYSAKKLSDQIKNADKRSIPIVVCIGKDEIETGNLKIKRLSDGKEEICTEENLVDIVRSLLK